MGRGELEMRKPVPKPFVAIQWRKDEGLEEEVRRQGMASQGGFLAS